DVLVGLGGHGPRQPASGAVVRDIPVRRHSAFPHLRHLIDPDAADDFGERRLVGAHLLDGVAAQRRHPLADGLLADLLRPGPGADQALDLVGDGQHLEYAHRAREAGVRAVGAAAAVVEDRLVVAAVLEPEPALVGARLVRLLAVAADPAHEALGGHADQ